MGKSRKKKKKILSYWLLTVHLLLMIMHHGNTDNFKNPSSIAIKTEAIKKCVSSFSSTHVGICFVTSQPSRSNSKSKSKMPCDASSLSAELKL